MSILLTLSALVVTATSVVGAASIIVQGIAKITAITPSTKDDEVVGKVQKALQVTSTVLDKVALNLPATTARK